MSLKTEMSVRLKCQPSVCHYTWTFWQWKKIKEVLPIWKGHQIFLIVCSKVVLFMLRKEFLHFFLSASVFFFGANFQNFPEIPIFLLRWPSWRDLPYVSKEHRICLFSVAKTEMSSKLKSHPNWNIPKPEMSSWLKCQPNWCHYTWTFWQLKCHKKTKVSPNWKFSKTKCYLILKYQ